MPVDNAGRWCAQGASGGRAYGQVNGRWHGLPDHYKDKPLRRMEMAPAPRKDGEKLKEAS